MRDRLCRIAFGAALASASVLHAAPALAACGPADSGFSESGALTALRVSVDVTQSRVLMGRKGERIATHPQPIWLTTSGDPLPRTWMDKVDWTAYRVDDGKGAAHAQLLFDADGRLCRVQRLERRALGTPTVTGGHAFEYDADGSLLRVAEFERTQGAAYTLAGQVCLRRDAQGALQAFIAGPCGDAMDAAPGRRYVRDAAGTLLRVIDAAANEPVAVQTYDERGRPATRYVRRQSPFPSPDGNDGPGAYAEPVAPQDRLHVIEREALSRLSTDVAGNAWRIVRLKEDIALDDTDMVSWDPSSQTVLAEGVTGEQGQCALDPAAQQKVWKAMQDEPGRILWYTDPMSRLVLVPAMPAATWRACTDPANVSRDACL
ncbi:hypothetical protein [Achromobacter sp.]|uniref:hypothetical protein n=1 Tax=Achromobacter sp. TaxID=134375 RepID=UPI0028B01690|nr:hypothetical protein [Achromobacter sp.]